MTWLDLAGWLGALLLLAAYLLVSAGRPSRTFHALNLLGGALLAASSFARDAFPSATLNLLWIAIALVALVRRRPPG